jgi:hypothetical protein
MPRAHKASDHQCTGLISVEVTDIELQSLGTESVSLNEDSTKCDDSFGSEKKFGLQDYFVSKEWHGPYVEAVCGADEVKREAIIAEAERAIVGRFIELLVSAVETDEILDLQSAAYAITELKKASAVVYTP